MRETTGRQLSDNLTPNRLPARLFDLLTQEVGKANRDSGPAPRIEWSIVYVWRRAPVTTTVSGPLSHQLRRLCCCREVRGHVGSRHGSNVVGGGCRAEQEGEENCRCRESDQRAKYVQ